MVAGLGLVRPVVGTAAALTEGVTHGRVIPGVPVGQAELAGSPAAGRATASATFPGVLIRSRQTAPDATRATARPELGEEVVLTRANAQDERQGTWLARQATPGPSVEGRPLH